MISARIGDRERQELVKLVEMVGGLDFRSRDVAEEVCAHAQSQGLPTSIRCQNGGLFAVEVQRS